MTAPGTLTTGVIGSADDIPPPARLHRLRAEGLPVVADADFRAAVDRLADRGRQLLARVHSDGWGWTDVAPD